MDEGSLSDTQRTMVLPLLQETNIRGKPYITVSAKGIVNGLSRYPNDGADFGPDTTKGATAPGQYGSPYTETTGIQEMVNYGIANGYSGKLLSGQFSISQSITIPHGITIIGSGIISFKSFNPYPLSSSTEPITPATASVIVNNSSNDAINITVNYEAVNLDNFSVLLKQTGATGIKCSPPTPTTQMGMVYSNWGEISVYSEVGDPSNYAFWFDNIGHCTFGNLLSYAMLELHVDTLTGYDNGNSTFLHVYGSTAHLSSAPTNHQVAILYSGSGGSTNIINFVYLQIDIYGQTSTYYGLYIGQNVRKIAVDFLDMELNGGTIGNTSLLLYTNGELYINKIMAYNGGTLYTDGYGILTIEDAISLAASSIFTNNGGLLYVEKNLGRYTVSINTESGGFTRIGVNPRYEGNLPAATLPANPPVSGTAYQNTNPYDIRLKIPVTYSPTSTAAATLATGISSTSTVTTSTKVSIPAGLTAADGEILTYDMVVPAGQYYEVVVTNATIGTVEVQAA